MVFTWLGLSRSGGESLPPTIRLEATSSSQTPVVSMSSNHKLEIQNTPELLEKQDSENVHSNNKCVLLWWLVPWIYQDI